MGRPYSSERFDDRVVRFGVERPTGFPGLRMWAAAGAVTRSRRVRRAVRHGDRRARMQLVLHSAGRFQFRCGKYFSSPTIGCRCAPCWARELGCGPVTGLRRQARQARAEVATTRVVGSPSRRCWPVLAGCDPASALVLSVFLGEKGSNPACLRARRRPSPNRSFCRAERCAGLASAVRGKAVLAPAQPRFHVEPVPHARTWPSRRFMEPSIRQMR